VLCGPIVVINNHSVVLNSLRSYFLCNSKSVELISTVKTFSLSFFHFMYAAILAAVLGL